jgi:ABC-type nitrate/sulfonate/bicarbonate transport system permease component
MTTGPVTSGRRMPRLAAVRRPVLGATTLLLLLAAWQVVGTRQLIPFVVPFTDALDGAWSLVTGDQLGTDVLPSAARAVGGFLLGAAVGYVVGIAVGIAPVLERWTRPALELARSTPVPILIPVVFAVFGASDGTRVGLIGAASMWPVLLNTADGVRAVDPRLLDVALVAGLRRWRRLNKVIVRASLPQVFAGLRIALGLSLVMMVVSEMTSAESGLGRYVLQAQRSFALLNMYSGVLVLAALGGVLSLAFNLVERRVLAWYHRQKDLSHV